MRNHQSMPASKTKPRRDAGSAATGGTADVAVDTISEGIEQLRMSFLS